jgi:hypothetical protein
MSTRGSSSVLPLLQALIAGNRRFDPVLLGGRAIERALDIGLGPALACVTCDVPSRTLGLPDVLAADLTARLLTSERFEILETVVGSLSLGGCAPVLLKGCGTALQYYAEPHHRTMGDLDVLVAADQLGEAEERLRSLGFEQRGSAPAAGYARHHHSKPLWHPERRTWVELHSRLYPPRSPMASAPPLQLDGQLTPIAVGRQSALAMTHELQLVYTATRWTEALSPERGVWPLLDVALLMRRRGAALDWDRVCAIADGSWAATGVRVVLSSLSRWELGSAPETVMRRLARADRFGNGVVLASLHRLATTYVIGGRPPGRVLSRHRLRRLWASLVAPLPPRQKLAALPLSLIGPSDGPAA